MQVHDRQMHAPPLPDILVCVQPHEQEVALLPCQLHLQISIYMPCTCAFSITSGYTGLALIF